MSGTRVQAYLLCLGLAAAPAAAADPEDPLWRAAVESASEVSNVMPRTVTVRFMGNDPATGAICRRDGVLTLKGMNAGGAADWHSVYTEDILGLQPKGMVECTFGPEAKGDIEIPGVDCSPLLPWYQDRVTFEETGERRRIDDSDCVVYEFKWKRSCFDRKAAVGQACLDAVDGTPVEIRYEHRRAPKGLRSAVSIVRYRDLGDLGPNPVSFSIEVLAKTGEYAAEPYRITGEFRDHARTTP